MLFGEGPQIKNIAEDLNKLFRQGSLLNQSVQTVEGDSTADQGTRDLLAARDPVIQEISVGMSGEQSARYTVSGTPPLSLPNSLGKPLKAWEVDVVPYQEGTGDPSPSNVRPIHGTDIIGVYVGSPNVWDEEWENGDISSTTGQDEPNQNLVRTKNYIPIIGNATYFPACASLVSNSLRARFYDANKTYIGYVTLSGNVVSCNYAFTTVPNAAYMRFATPTAYGNTYKHDIAINYPATVTAYNSHQGGITSITLPQTVYTGTIGSDGGESRVAYALLNDPDKWIDSGTTTITFQYDQEFSDRRRYAGSYEGLMCTYYPVDAQITNTARWRGALSYYFGIKTNSLTLEQIKADAAAGKIAICYDLATPTTFAVTSPTIPTPTGTATTWATAENGTVDSMEVTYVGKA